ncbi:hypothetical protein XPA_008090 [Xanthoria parietina]
MSVAPAGWKHIETTSCLLLIAIIMTILRIRSRRRVRLAVAADDWSLWIALGLVFVIYIEGLIWVLYGGIGKHNVDLSPAERTALLKGYVVCFLTFPVTFVATKLSILLLYVRIFPVIRIRIACIVVGLLVSAQGFTLIIIVCFQCRPFSYIWNKTIPGGVCLPLQPVFYGTVIPTILLAAIVVFVPMPVIWNLHMKMAQRLALLAIFASGVLVCVAGALRMSSIHGFKTKDLSYAIAPAAMLVIVEPCLAVICVCLPTIAPALQDIASYSTIEYLKMICRIKTAVAPQRSPSTERAEIYTPVDRSGEKIYGHRCGVSPDLESQLQEDDEEEEARQREGSQRSLEEIPEKAVMVRGRWASV